jgi:hypothetical protein
MPSDTEIRASISEALNGLATAPILDASRRVFETLGYKSERRPSFPDSKPTTFLENFDGQGSFNAERGMLGAWKSADFISQVTDEEIQLARKNQPSLLADGKIEKGNARSFAFLSIGLNEGNYTRAQYSGITREINRMFNMPAICLFKNNGAVTLSVIDRRQHKKESAKDVLEKVTLIKDIDYKKPHRGHVDILSDLALPNLAEKYPPLENFDHLLRAWRETLDISTLNKRFYRELSNWYFWALPQVRFPVDLEQNDEKLRPTSLIRLLTRLVFCWFLKEKSLIPNKLFCAEDLGNILKGFDPESETSSTYYLAILQNLFFATLNQRMGKDSSGNPYRAFAKDEGFLKNRSTYDVNNLYRYESLFKDDPEAALAHFADIPFLNGGLFECLDRTEDGTDKKLYLDGFSRNPKKRPHVPDRLFFDSGEVADLSDVYDDKKRKTERVTGLINILNRYKFTIVENTPIDEEVALDPELLGKVFENLLASYNEETKTTARKQTGSFYTPRPIVDYMVDESLKAHLTKVLVEKAQMERSDTRNKLDILFTYTEQEHAFSPVEVDILITAIDALKILDPACGSGAFPMGVLHKLVYILGKLDPHNDCWKETQLAKLDSAPMREELERAFAENNDDYGRKLYLIENCLYGVDIQPIAIQITKLRFFISLVCDQKTNRNKKENHGIRPLPNLETKFVAANSLISLPEMTQSLLVDPRVGAIEREIESIYHSHFSTQRRDQKMSLQKRIKALRDELAKLLVEGLISPTKAKHIALWDAFNPQSSADFFDPSWMFGKALTNGFDVVIGNPPWGQKAVKFSQEEKDYYRKAYKTGTGILDLFKLFCECGVRYTRAGGLWAMILPDIILLKNYEETRRLLLSETAIEVIAHTGMAFEAAQIDSVVIVAEKKVQKENTAQLIRIIQQFGRNSGNTPDLVLPQELFWKLRGLKFNLFLTPERQRLVERLNKLPPLLNYYHAHEGIHSGNIREKLFIEKQQTKLCKKLIFGRDELSRYRVAWGGKWVNYNPDLADRANGEYANLGHLDYFLPPKVLVRRTGDFVMAAVDRDCLFCSNNLFVVHPQKEKCHITLEALAGILNSQLITWYFRAIQPRVGKLFAELKINQLHEFPLPQVDLHEKASEMLSPIVKRIIETKKTNVNGDTKDLEGEIDQQVYALYGLTPEEITMVEGTAQNAVSADTSSDVQIRELQHTKEEPEITSSPSIEVSADDQEAEQRKKAKKERNPHSNNEDNSVRIDETEQNDVLCKIRQMFSEGLELSRELAFKKIAKELGYDRVGSKIEETLDSDIRTAVKRGILENERGTLKILCKTIEGYEREFLKDQFLASIGRPWVEREEAVRAFTRFMGFRRAGEKIQDTVRSLINGLLREDRLESDGQMIRRKS